MVTEEKRKRKVKFADYTPFIERGERRIWPQAGDVLKLELDPKQRIENVQIEISFEIEEAEYPEVATY